MIVKNQTRELVYTDFHKIDPQVVLGVLDRHKFSAVALCYCEQTSLIEC